MCSDKSKEHMANTSKEKAPVEESASGKKPATKPTAKAAGKTVRATRTEGGQSPAERIQALEAEIARIRRDEHDSRYNLITQALDELNAMGYQYRLVDENKAATRVPKKATAGAAVPKTEAAAAPVTGTPGLSAHYDEKKYCKLCKEMGHDQKAHNRAGDFQHKPFSNEEKARRGVLPPELQESFLAELQG